jgi:hypothetical protein
MPKGKKKRDKAGKGGIGAWGSAQFWAPLARELIGDFAGEVMAHKTTKSSSSKSKKDKGDERERDHRHKQQDVAGEVVRVLSESGPQSVAQLLAQTNVGLSPLLRALRDSRDFRLVEMVGDDDTVQLTPSGSRVASTLRREGIESEGRKRLES